MPRIVIWSRERKLDWLSNLKPKALGLPQEGSVQRLPRLDQEPVSTKCMEGVGEDSHSQAFNHWLNSAVLALSHLPHCCLFL